MKGERMAKRSSFGSIMRRRLSDITNSQSLPKVMNQEEKPELISVSAENYISQLIKEKTTLVKLVEERNKIIELTGAELQNLRINLQKLQLQNWNLAQSNSQILAELNLGREKLKALQHELVCKDALLKAKNSDVEKKSNANGPGKVSQEVEEASVEQLDKSKDENKPTNRNRQRAARSQSLGPSLTHRQGQEKDKVESKRRCVRRQSARFKSQEREPKDDLFEIEDTTFPVTSPVYNKSIHENGSTSSSIKEETVDPRMGIELPQRSSLGRPLRRAVGKVQSYKEIPINVKMRRME